MWLTYLGDFLDLLGHAYCKMMEKIGLKAPGSYYAPFWSYNFLICLCERLKLNIFMISGFLRLVGNLMYGFEYTNSL